jgi:Right handed beta helix region
MNAIRDARLTWLLGLSAVKLLTAASPVPAQGPLAPPGAPGPAMKTLQEIEPRTPISSLPFIINSSGSYYVTTNLFLEGPSLFGICIDANDVMLDLNGFVLSAEGDGDAAIVATNPVSNITIRNGTLREWEGTAVSLVGSDFRLIDVTAIGVDGDSAGFQCGDHSVLIRCTAREHLQGGFYVERNSVLEGCRAFNAGFGGFRVGDRTLVKDCVAVDNQYWTGIDAGDHCEIRGCITIGNGFYGIDAGMGANVVDCLVASNAYTGIYVQENSLVRSCHLTRNGTGIFVSGGSHVLLNTLEDSGTTVQAYLGAITVYGSNSLVENNHVVVRAGAGILIQPGFTFM